MHDIRNAVRRLFINHDGKFATRHLARILGISSNRASVHLRRLVETRELERVGDGRNAKYQKGPTWALGVRGGAKTTFWTRLALQQRDFAYIELVRLGTTLEKRMDIVRAFDELWSKRIVVVDFDGVLKMSHGFAESLLVLAPHRWAMEIIPINMCDAVRAVARRAVLLDVPASSDVEP